MLFLFLTLLSSVFSVELFSFSVPIFFFSTLLSLSTSIQFSSIFSL